MNPINTTNAISATSATSVTNERFEPRIVGFLCNWCSYAGADLAGVSRLSYPPNLRIVRVPCSGRVDPLFVARAFKEGADGVLVLGCHPGDCHYSEGNFIARRRFAVMQELLLFLGFERARVRLDWVSASEGARFANVVAAFTEQVRRLGPWQRTGSTAALSWLDQPPGAGGAPLADLASAPAGAAAANQALRDLAGQLLSEQRAEVVLGWEQGSLRPRPLFARTPEQAQRLMINIGTPLNLVNYLRNLRGQRVALVVSPNDLRTLNVLLSEGQCERGSLLLIGLDAAAPQSYDAVLPLPAPPAHRAPAAGLTVADVEAWPAARRAEFWQVQFSHCQRCYACRQACPLCYCTECLSEQLDPAWQSIAIDLQEKTFFHVMRAFHLAGRCGDCQACSQACPLGVPLYLLNRKVAQETARLFDGFTAGASPDAILPLAAFRRDESLEASQP